MCREMSPTAVLSRFRAVVGEPEQKFTQIYPTPKCAKISYPIPSWVGEKQKGKFQSGYRSELLRIDRMRSPQLQPAMMMHHRPPRLAFSHSNHSSALARASVSKMDYVGLLVRETNMSCSKREVLATY